MIKTNLPVIILKGIVLLPNNDIRLEFNSTDNKNIIDVSELFHDNEILVVSLLGKFNGVCDIDKLPKVGVISKITHKMELPNGKTRVIITGYKRANVHEYLNLKNNIEMLESIVSDVSDVSLDASLEAALIRKLYREIDSIIKFIPSMSNSVLSLISNVTDLSKMTDIVAPFLPIDGVRLHDYLMEPDKRKRAEYILEDLYKEKELSDIDRKIDDNVKKSLDDNQREMILREKLKNIKEELGEHDYKTGEINKLKADLAKLKAPRAIKNRIADEICRFENLTPLSAECSVVKTYIDWLLSLPWKYETHDNNNLLDVRKTLDESHYALDNVKTRIVEFLAVKQMTRELRGPIICLVGPPGVGKTSLAFSIARAMNRNFVKMSVGGVNDEAEIIGHRKTYVGANPGRIISSMKRAGSVNPVFLIDEIDKMTRDIKGDPASALLDVFDSTQNKYFVDNYIDEEYDLSKVMFITTANDVSGIPSPLRDRLEIVEISGYTEYEKLDICRNHLINKILLEHGIADMVSFSDEALVSIIRYYTKEAGIRELERQLSTIIRKIVTSFVTDSDGFSKVMVGPDDVKRYLGKERYHYVYHNTFSQVGVVNGLAYTPYGGDVIPIEVNFYKGHGDLVLTGSLGDVMRESAQIALSYVKSNCDRFNINYSDLVDNDIHIHVPACSIQKDGPSAGVALTTSLISALSNRSVSSSCALTGEITLRGNVLGIGGLKEKCIGACRNNIEKIFIPYDNLADVDLLPREIVDKLLFIPVNNYSEIYERIFGD